MTLSVDHIHHLDRQLVPEGEEQIMALGCHQSEFRYTVSKRHLRLAESGRVDSLDS